MRNTKFPSTVKNENHFSKQFPKTYRKKKIPPHLRHRNMWDFFPPCDRDMNKSHDCHIIRKYRVWIIISVWHYSDGRKKFWKGDKFSREYYSDINGRELILLMLCVSLLIRFGARVICFVTVWGWGGMFQW